MGAVGDINNLKYNIKINGQIFGARPDERGPIGGGEGYKDIFINGDYIVRTAEELIAALGDAVSGEVVYIPGDVEIDLSSLIYIDNLQFDVRAGVTLASNRGHDGSPGALIYTDVEKDRQIFKAYNDCWITGLRIRGPNPKQMLDHHKRAFGSGGGGDDYYYSFPWHRGVWIYGNNVEIDNCELSGFSHAAIGSSGNVAKKQAQNVKVHHNFIHHNQYNGLGYGVSVNYGAEILISHNLFNNNRHSIASDPRHGSYYEAHNNIELDVATSHAFDMHGNAADTFKSVYIHHNTFDCKNTSINVRGEGREQSLITKNWFRNYPEYKVLGTERESVTVEDNALGNDPIEIEREEIEMGLENGLFDQETLGSELFGNADYSSWVGDNPTNWTVGNEDANNYITEHVNGARLVSNDTSAINMYQTITVQPNTVYKLTVTVSNYASGDVRLKIYDNSNAANILAPTNMGWTSDATYNYSFLTPNGCVSITPQFYRATGGSTDLVYSAASLKPVTSPHKGTYNWPYSAGALEDSGNPTNNTLYRIMARSIVDFTTIGSADNVVGTYFYSTGTGVTLSAVDNLRPVQSSIAPEGTNAIEIDESNQKLVITGDGSDDKGATLPLSDAADLSADLTIGSNYIITIYDAQAINGDVDIEVAEADDTELASVTLTGGAAAAGVTLEFTATHATTNKLQLDNLANTEVVKFSQVTIQEVSAEGGRGLSRMGMSMQLR